MEHKTWHFCPNGEKWRPYEAFLCSLCRACDPPREISLPADRDPNKPDEQ